MTTTRTTNRRSILVTVGTTRFDELVDAVTRVEALEWMVSHGYTELIIQHGKGPAPVFLGPPGIISCVAYSFTPNLSQDMSRADLVLSHAGAGTVMEALRLHKRLVVVINSRLMDNHQTELANAMAQRQHLFVIENPSDLRDLETWNTLDAFVPLPQEVGDEYDFGNMLDAHMGIVRKR